MFDDEDYGFLTGGDGDLNGDGRIDFVEYDNYEYDFQHIMGKTNDDDDLSSDNDWEIECLSEAEDYGLNPYDYIDRDDFETALEEAKMKSDEDSDNIFGDEDSDEDSDDGEVADTSSFEAAKAAFLTAGFSGVKRETKKEKTASKTIDNKESNSAILNLESLESKYYDKDEEQYNIFHAIYNTFAEIRENYEFGEEVFLPTVIGNTYKYNKQLGIKIWKWILDNFPSAITNKGVASYNEQGWLITDSIFSELITIDNDNDEDYILDYVTKHPDLEKIIFCKADFGDKTSSFLDYVPYCIDHNLQKNFKTVYNGVFCSPYRNKKEWSNYELIHDVIMFSSINGVRNADPWFYTFLKKEIEKLNQPIKENDLMQLLNKSEYGTSIFAKPTSNKTTYEQNYDKNQHRKEVKQKYKEEQIEKNCVTEDSDNTACEDEEYDVYDDLSLKEQIEWLRGDVEILENKCKFYEDRIKWLTDEIKALKLQNEPEAYYCRIHFENSAKGQAFWYKCDDTTVKVGDSVTAPFGYKNDELVGTVVEAGYYKSCDFDFPISKMKAIIEKNSK